jgi:hypothetical protein
MPPKKNPSRLLAQLANPEKAAAAAAAEAKKREEAEQLIAAAAAAASVGPQKIDADLIKSTIWRQMEAELEKAKTSSYAAQTYTCVIKSFDAATSTYIVPVVTYTATYPYTIASELEISREYAVKLLPALEKNSRIKSLFQVGTKVLIERYRETGEMMENPAYDRHQMQKQRGLGSEPPPKIIPVLVDFIIAYAPEDYPLLRNQVRGWDTNTKMPGYVASAAAGGGQ